MKKDSLIPLIVILGPTVSGKTFLSLKLAKIFNGEIINADSRQIYKEMNIGTAKIKGKILRGRYTAGSIAHYLIDIKKPSQKFSAQMYKDLAVKAGRQIFKRGKIPFLVGGTGLYIKSVVDNLDIPKIKADWKLRKNLERKSVEELIEMLKRKDPESLKFMDLKNKRRIVRALEVILKSAKKFSELRKSGEPIFRVLRIGLRAQKNKLEKNISLRLRKQIADGLEKEARFLYQKYGTKAPGLQTIGYQEFIKYFKKEISKKEVIGLIEKNTKNYAKRQMTWFKKDKQVIWISGEKQAKDLIEKFLKNI